MEEHQKILRQGNFNRRDGNIKLEGIPRKVITEFMSGFVEHNEENSPNVEKNGVAASNLPLGIAEAVTTDKTLLKIDRVWLENLEGQKIDEIDKNTNEYYVKFIIEAKKDIQKVVPGVIVTNELGDFVVAVNSKWAGSSLKTTLTDKNKYLIKFKLLNIYEQGNYKISVNVVSEDFNTFYAWKNEVCSLYVNRPYVTGGKVNPPSTVEITEL